MRSDLIFGALKHIPNRYLLVRALAKASRGLHKPGTRIQDTMNDVLTRFGSANPIAPHDAVSMTAAVPPGRNQARAAQLRNSRRERVSPIRETQHPLPETGVPTEIRKRA